MAISVGSAGRRPTSMPPGKKLPQGTPGRPMPGSGGRIGATGGSAGATKTNAPGPNQAGRWNLPGPGQYEQTTVTTEDGGSYQAWREKATGKIVLGVPMGVDRDGGGRTWEYQTLEQEKFDSAYQDRKLALWAYPQSKLNEWLNAGDIMENEYRQALEDQAKYGATWFAMSDAAQVPAAPEGAGGTGLMGMV